MKIPNIPSVQAYNGNDQRQMSEATNKDAEQQPQSEKDLIEAVEQLNSIAAEQSQHFLKFTYHKEAEQYYVKVIDSKTDQVIREIPSKEILDYFSEMKKFIGILFDQSI